MKTSSQLRKLIRKRERELKGKFNKDLVKTKLELFTRINTPLICIIFIFLGFSLGIKQSRGRNRSSGPPALIIVTIFYAITFLGISLAKKGIIPASFAIFLPSMIALTFGIKQYRKLEWLS